MRNFDSKEGEPKEICGNKNKKKKKNKKKNKKTIIMNAR